MQTVSCPNCGRPLENARGSCARCGQSIFLRLPAGVQESETLEWNGAGPTDRLRNPGGTQAAEAGTTQLLGRAEHSEGRVGDLAEVTVNLKRMRRGARERLGADVAGSLRLEEDQDDEVVERRATWQKVVEHRTEPIMPAATSGLYQRLQTSLRTHVRSPRAYFWLSVMTLACILLAGGFSAALGAARRLPSQAVVPVLQVSPGTVALGGIVTLRGLHFTPHALVMLSRDAHLPLEDTGGAGSVQVDAHGIFSDTVIVDPVWLAGPHTLGALDARTHRQLFSSLMVIGRNALQGPPRLLFSAPGLDFGSGDEATSASRLLALSNAGGGEVTWQATVSQPWLEISPMSGVIPGGRHFSTMVAVDRSRLAPGQYHAQVLFVSSTERISLAVTMAVIALQPEHEAVLQISPAALTFSGSARGRDPQVQTVVVSNPGVQVLSWEATIALPNGQSWLWLGQQTGVLEPGDQQQLGVGVSTQNLAPGVYRGEISFINLGTQPVQGSPQYIYVSLTVTPSCVLTFAPGNLNFTGVHTAPSPAAQALRIAVASGCGTSQTWSVAASTTSGGNWLHISQSRASTPATPLVSVDTAGLSPGIYSGVLTFTIPTGPQIVPVTFKISPLPCTISGSSALALQGTVGQSAPLAQDLVLSVGGDCPQTLNWTGTVSGAPWLSLAPAGTLPRSGTASVNMQADLTGLSAGSYSGQVLVTVVDSSTGQTVASVQTSVTLDVQLPCTLQAPVPTSLPFNASVGGVLQSATVTIGVAGNCAGTVTLTAASDSPAWLSAGGVVTLSGGSTTSLTISVDPATLSTGSYSGTIVLSASDGSGTIAGSGQTIAVTLVVQ